jgi:hypothetical protein
MDPSDDCTFWSVGDYLKAGATSYSTKIGAFRLPGCLTASVSGIAFFDRNHNGKRDPGEAPAGGRRISDAITTAADGSFKTRLPADPAYGEGAYAIGRESVKLAGGQEVSGLEVPTVCEVRSAGAQDVGYWTKNAPKEFAARLRAGGVKAQAAALELNVKAGKLDGSATVHDPVAGDWPAIGEVAARVKDSAAYRDLLQQLNQNRAMVTPANPAGCATR